MTTRIPQVDLEALSKIPADELRLLWVNDWDDGPLESVVEYRGERCLMVLRSEDGPEPWLVFRLTEEQRADEEKWHALFVEHVGDHWCCHGPAIAHPAPADDPDPEKFYGPYDRRPPLDLTASAVLGWTDEVPRR